MLDMSIMEGKWGAGREAANINATTSRDLSACCSATTDVSYVTGLSLTTTSMSITPSMIAENDRIEEEISRANFAVFLAVQEEESRRCQRLTGSGTVSMQ